MRFGFISRGLCSLKISQNLIFLSNDLLQFKIHLSFFLLRFFQILFGFKRGIMLNLSLFFDLVVIGTEFLNRSVGQIKLFCGRFSILGSLLEFLLGLLCIALFLSGLLLGELSGLLIALEFLVSLSSVSFSSSLNSGSIFSNFCGLNGGILGGFLYILLFFHDRDSLVSLALSQNLSSLLIVPF